MEELQINPYLFFGALEMAMLFLVVAVVFFIRGKLLGDKITELKNALKKAEDVEPPEAVSYEQYLRDEVLRNEGIIEQAVASDGKEEKKTAELLLFRKQFLELEVEASSLEGNPVAFQERLAAGLGELVEQLRPEPETVTETVTETVEEEAVDSDTGESNAERSQLDTHDEEFDRLKQVISNQHEAMAALREELKARESEIEDLDVILAKLDEFEQHDDELQRCLDMLEKENQRLKEANSQNASSPGSSDSSGKIEPMDPAQLTGLKSMLGDQQQTIHNLQTLLQELAPEASKAKELEEAMANIERANQELDSCVAVLEDENAMLRAELDAINAQLEQQALEEEAAEAKAAEEKAAQELAEAAAEAEVEAEADIDIAMDEPELSEDDEKHQLEIKVEELEALVEFKDAAIEELEKQYSSLESKYLAISGEKRVD